MIFHVRACRGRNGRELSRPKDHGVCEVDLTPAALHALQGGHPVLRLWRPRLERIAGDVLVITGFEGDSEHDPQCRYQELRLFEDRCR